jgi:DNA-binding NarL/FixJ family response regulator
MEQNSAPKSALVVDGIPLTRFGIASAIDCHPRFRVCGEASDGPTALALCAELRPDLIALDLAVPRGGGIQLIHDFHKLHPAAEAIVISDQDDAFTVQHALRAGARAFISKQDEPTEIVAGLEFVLGGGLFTSKRVSRLLLEEIAARNRKTIHWEVATLSDRELQIFRLMGSELGTTAIARELGRSVKTVETHQQRMKEKLHVAGIRGLQEHAIRWFARSTLNVVPSSFTKRPLDRQGTGRQARKTADSRVEVPHAVEEHRRGEAE